MKTLKHQVALNLPNVVALLIVYGRHVVQAMTNNPWFPNPTPTLQTVSADLDQLETAEATVLSGINGAAAARDLRRKLVEDGLHGLKAHVYGIAGQHPDEAKAIIQSAGMFPKQYTARVKPELEASMSPTPQEVRLRAKSAGGRVSYEWQYSVDGGVTWIAAGTTTVADTSVQGLSVGATYAFRFRTTIRKTTGAWSQTISFVVH